MRRFETLVTALLIVAPAVVPAGESSAGLDSGHAYRETCRLGLGADGEANPSPERATARRSCLDFTAGVLAGYGFGWPAGAHKALRVGGDLDKETFERLFAMEKECFPHRLSHEQVASRVLIRLQFHPEEAELPSAKLITAIGCFTRDR